MHGTEIGIGYLSTQGDLSGTPIPYLALAKASRKPSSSYLGSQMPQRMGVIDEMIPAWIGPREEHATCRLDYMVKANYHPVHAFRRWSFCHQDHRDL
jgi:hypothetical protein